MQIKFCNVKKITGKNTEFVNAGAAKHTAVTNSSEAMVFPPLMREELFIMNGSVKFVIDETLIDRKDFKLRVDPDDKRNWEIVFVEPQLVAYLDYLS